MKRMASMLLILLAGAAPQDAKPDWIWIERQARANQVGFFRKSFTLPAGVRKATLTATADDRMRAWINGKDAGRSNAWQHPILNRDVTRLLRKGRNALAVRAENGPGGPAAMFLRLELTLENGKKRSVLTDASWKCTGAEAKGWRGEEFEAKAWKSATSIGKLGIGPWGDVSLARPTASSPPPPLSALKDFNVEPIYTVPKATEGSWVSMTFDPKGRIIVSPQSGNKLYRVTLGETIQTEPIELGVGAAQGLLYAYDSLYVVGNGPQGTGFYRLRDEDGNDAYDRVDHLIKWPGGMGEHGPHGVVKGPDGKLYIMIGNHVNVPPGIAETSAYGNSKEDLLLPRQWDANGHARGRLAPGGYVVRTDAEGKSWEMFCAGFRNAYDIAFTADGELFTYDSDMEWDVGLPWYRPTRINHLVSGGEYGWRSGTGKWPGWYPDSLPTTLDIGRGSPTGMAVGTGAKFPAKYQRAVYAVDWAFGKIYAVHLTPGGATYLATSEVFVQGRPLNVADLEVGPDGALYFITGGRGTQARLYRVSYVGSESTAAAPAPATSEAQELRRKLESWHGRRDPAAVDAIWPHLSHEDRWVRFAARVALERQEIGTWAERALREGTPAALLALARKGESKHLAPLVEALGNHEASAELHRIAQVALIRLGPPDGAVRATLLKRLDPLYPAATAEENRELSRLLVYLESDSAVGKTLKLLKESKAQEEQIHLALVLRNAKKGWTMEERRTYFEWFNTAQAYKGGHSFKGFLRNIKREALATVTPDERRALDPVLRSEYVARAAAEEKRPVVKEWAMEDLLSEVESMQKGRSFRRGQEAFARTKCLACHRFGDEGGSTGPDVTAVASRFGRRDILQAILEPSAVISDQYHHTRYLTKDGEVIVGRALYEEDGKLFIRTDPLKEELLPLSKDAIQASKPSKISPMPKGLVNTLNRQELLDLVAYLLSEGDRRHPLFRR